jgi:serine/threonine protein kinase
LLEDIVIGGYRRANVMQTGQNSEVWEVVEITTQKHFAMKLLLPERVQESGQRAFLKHEARVGLKLQHPRIIKFHKFVNDRHNPYILSVKPRMRSLIDQIASSLEYVHSKGWVHRDIKPDNVLVNGSGEVRLIDFALAVRSASPLVKRFFRSKRAIAGTRSYMSPEQIRGLPLDIRADMYSLGVMLYEMASGKLPFVASSGQELLKKHLQADPPSISPDRKVTPEFEGLILRMMAKKEANRPANLSEFQSELRRIKLFKDEQ